ncbi:hypothetical protein BpHYR1_038263 [Brachionus plicatilis]|uniref:Uncharacterized protein n=1 Tax=Brachionus plicatilis TaxID=10195 RepID=A0A3M7RGJ2_BRAPC|nr:hypothetical protein BpHYR1_038263 [Brachionus plicatilis]
MANQPDLFYENKLIKNFTFCYSLISTKAYTEVNHCPDYQTKNLMFQFGLIKLNQILYKEFFSYFHATKSLKYRS